jgi:hypothetical protein
VLSAILPLVTTLGVAVVLAFWIKPSTSAEKRDWVRELRFTVLSILCAIPCGLALDPIPVTFATGPSPFVWRGALTVFAYLSFLAPLAGFLADVVYVRVRNGRRSARLRAGQCVMCGYNLTGNVSGRCPECGTRLTDASSPGAPEEWW